MILHVFGVSSGVEMLGVYAPRMIALVIDLHSRWDRAIHEFPSKTVGKDRSPTYRKLPVATSVLAALPRETPIFIRSSNIATEAFL